MKRVLIIILALSLCITILVGCNKQQSESDESMEPTAAAPTTAPTDSTGGTDISSLALEDVYNFDGTTNTLLGFQDTIIGVTDITIPNEIGGQAVLNIAPNAFMSKGLNSVVLPDSIKVIGGNAFNDNNLTQIIFPDSLTNIEASAFMDNKLSEVTIPQGFTEVKIGTFRNNLITKLTLPDTMVHLRRSAFQDNELTEITFPSSIKTIESHAFQNNELESVVFNDGLERIDGHAFESNKLTSITIPTSVTLIGASTDGMKSPQYYDRYTFAYNQLTEITISGSNTEIKTFLMGGHNFVRNAYNDGGAGTYVGTQNGKWEKQ